MSWEQWQTPKTDWVGTDHFSNIDWLRITRNMNELHWYIGVPFTPLDTVIPYETVLTSADRNNITDTLEKLLAKAGSSWNRGLVAKRVDYGAAWNSTDLNTIEETILNLKKQCDGEISGNDFYRCGEEVCCGDTFSVGLL